MRSILLIGLAGAALSVAQLAWASCPPPPCDDADDCAIRADWILEGTLQNVIPGDTYRYCEPGGAPQNVVCGLHTDVPTLLLKDVVVVRGKSPLFRRRPVEIRRAFYCLSGPIGIVPGQSSIDVDQRLLGKRLRFSGTNARTAQIVPGFIVAQILPGPG
ncbi:MAG: hypothetical protein JO111_09935 [Caulobacteraceae bacterium]|nr:hypothetical protein [Caulobacteraceae bacterium]